MPRLQPRITAGVKSHGSKFEGWGTDKESGTWRLTPRGAPHEISFLRDLTD